MTLLCLHATHIGAGHIGRLYTTQDGRNSQRDGGEGEMKSAAMRYTTVHACRVLKYNSPEAHS